MMPSHLPRCGIISLFSSMASIDEKEESYAHAQDAKWAVTHSPLVWGLIILE